MAEVVLRELPPCTRLSLQGGLAALPALGAAFGLALPAEPLRATAAAARAALWLGPDEWLLLAEDGAAGPLLSALEAARGEVPASLVDVSHCWRGIELAGPDAAPLLNEGCPLDLDDGAFPPGRCTRTLFGKAEILLWQREPGLWRLEVARSFVPWLLGLLREAAGDLPRGDPAGH